MIINNSHKVVILLMISITKTMQATRHLVSAVAAMVSAAQLHYAVERQTGDNFDRTA